MSKVWEEILKQMGLDSFESIENIQCVMTFMGYSTLKSISDLRLAKSLKAFEADVHKLLRYNSIFHQQHPNLKEWNFGEGAIAVVQEVANAAATCASSSDFDELQVQKTTHEQCQKVVAGLKMDDVMINLHSIPKTCEIICPCCRSVIKLSLIKHANPIPKFNPYNFARHFKIKHEQHSTRKRKPLSDLSNDFSPIPNASSSTMNKIQRTNVFSSVYSSAKRTILFEDQSMNLCFTGSKSPRTPETPRTTRIMTLQKNLYEAQCKIKTLESEIITSLSPSTLNASQQNENTCESDGIRSKIKDLESTLQNQSIKMHELSAENILLRHKIMDASKTVRVFCRMKPSTSVDDDCFNWERSDDAMQIKIDGGNCLNFDYVIKPEENNDDVFHLVQPLLQSLIEGFNICIIGFGASGSGKSHTMYGSNKNQGVIPRSVKFLLEAIKRRDGYDFEIKASCFEIYNETFIDLLHTGLKRNVIMIQKVGDVEKVMNLEEIDIKTEQDFDSVLKSASKNRKTGSTLRNSESSRSHVAFQISLVAKSGSERIASNIVFVDLAGMENFNDHLASSTTTSMKHQDRKLEMSKINQSLSSLRVCVEGLSKKTDDTHFRSSKLTHFLKPYLTKNTKTLLITTISQEKKYFASSKSSFEFAQLMRKIRIGDMENKY